MEGKGGEEQDQLPGEELTPQSVRKQLLALEKAVNKNRDLRTRYPTDPEKYVALLFFLLWLCKADYATLHSVDSSTLSSTSSKPSTPFSFSPPPPP